MKKYLLDTSLVAGYLLNRVRAIDLVSPLLKREEAATSILTPAPVNSLSFLSRNVGELLTISILLKFVNSKQPGCSVTVPPDNVITLQGRTINEISA